MDVQTVAIGGAVFVISALLIYLVSVFGMREKTYEEVIKEQRLKNIELFGKSASDTDKKKDKKKKLKKPKPEKQASVDDMLSQGDTVVTEAEQPVKMLELEIEPEIIEPDMPKAPETKKKGNKKTKSILHNKEEKSPVNKDLQSDEKIHTKPTPLDSVELKHDRERRLSGNQLADTNKQGKKSKKMAKEAKPEVAKVEPIVVEEVIQVQAAPVVQAEPKKGKKNKAATETGKDGSEASHLQSLVSGSHLTDAEIQVLVELLFSKQSTPTAVEWTKKSQKGDPMTIVKKQLQEKEKALEDEQARAMSTGNSLKETRQQLTTEREKLKQHQDEIGALHQRMQASADQHVAEMRALRTQLEQQATYDAQRLQENKQQLQEATQVYQRNQGDTSSLQQQLKLISEEMNKNVSKLSMVEGSKKKLEVKVGHYEEQIRALEAMDSKRQNNESVLNAKLSEVSQQLQHAQAHSQSLVADGQRAQQEAVNYRNQLDSGSSQMQDLDRKVQEMEKQVTDRDAVLQATQSQLLAVQSSNEQREQQLKDIEQSKFRLESELKTVTEQRQKQSVQAEKSENMQKQMGDKDKEIYHLQQELTTRQKEMTKLSEDLEQQRKKNNEMDSTSRQLENAISVSQTQVEQIVSLQTQLGERSSEIGSLQNELASFKASQHDSTTTFAEVQTKLQDTENSLDEAKQIIVQKEHALQEMSPLEEQITQLKAELAEKSDGVPPSNLETEVAKLKEEIVKLQGEVEYRDETVECVQAKIFSTQEQLKNTENELANKCSDVQHLEQEITEAREKFTSHDVYLTEARSELVERTQQLQSTQQLLQQQPDADETKQWQEKHRLLQEESMAKQTEFIHIRETLTLCRHEVIALKQVIVEKQAAIDSVRGDLAECSDANADTQLNIEVVKLRDRVADLEIEKAKALDKLCVAKDGIIEDLHCELDKLKEDMADSRQVLELKQLLVKRQAEIESLTCQLNSQLAAAASLTEGMQHDGSQAVADLQNRLASLQQQLQVTRKENNDLRAGCEKATKALTSAEKAAEEIAHVQKELKTKASEVNSLHEKLHQREQQIGELKEKHDKTLEALSKVEKVAQENVSEAKGSVTDAELADAHLTQSKLQSQVLHYKTVLADTESILNKLQTSVELEETKWHAKVRRVEHELKESRDELNRLRAESGAMQKMQNGASIVDENEELRAKLITLQKQLDRENQANRQLTAKLAVSAVSESGTAL